jgi:hypothetical protein
MRVVAGRQHWVLTRAQARKAGATRKALRYRLKGVGWEPMSPQVLRLLGSMPTFEQHRAARTLDNALTRKYVALEELRGVTIELLARGCTGSALMRELLGARAALGEISTRSGPQSAA